MPKVVEIEAVPLDIELSEPFGIATGTQLRAQNVLVTITLDDGTSGIGEAAPFPAVNAETQAVVLSALARARGALVGFDARRWRAFAAAAAEAMPEAPSARAAVESALLDALCRSARISLWTFFGGALPSVVTDITIPTGSVVAAGSAAERACKNGFSTLKIKVGGAAFDHDVARLRTIDARAPNVRLVLDANASLDAATALALLEAMGKARARVALFEQPTAAGDLASLRQVREQGRVRVCADESARSAADVVLLARERAADVVNVKLMKCGVVEALGMIEAARATGLGLMIGGMVESKLAMSVSACLAAGFGGFDFVDLDTPLFMKNAPFAGGWIARGPELCVDEIAFGHGVTLSA